VTVRLPEVLVSVTSLLDATPIPNVPVQASHAADASCPAGETFNLGVTDAGGQVLVALPYGTWTVLVNGVPSTVVLTPGTAPSDADGLWPFDVTESF
jgi:hypothetical protein